MGRPTNGDNIHVTAPVTVSALIRALDAASCYANALRTAGRTTDADVIDAQLNLLAAQAGTPSPVTHDLMQGRSGGRNIRRYG